MNIIFKHKTTGALRITHMIGWKNGDYKGLEDHAADLKKQADYADFEVVGYNCPKLPDRTFREAWRVTTDNSDVVIDMKPARDVWKAKMRQARAPKLAALDVEAMRAVETGDPTAIAAVSVKKQTLRDVTKDPRIEAAQTPEDLKMVWPEVLND